MQVWALCKIKQVNKYFIVGDSNLSDKVLGTYRWAGGLALTGQKPYFPDCPGQVTHSDYVECHRDHKTCAQCILERPCTECQYWPIYPCYSPMRPMVECLFEYTNDPISVDQSVPNGNSSEFYMYEKMIQEGHDPRLFRLSPDTNGGGHRGPENSQYWAIGCLGLTSACSEVLALHSSEIRGLCST